MADSSTLTMKTSKNLPPNIKPSTGTRPPSVGITKPLITPLPPAQQIKVVNRLINFFETK
jgi:hypothetical protein